MTPLLFAGLMACSPEDIAIEGFVTNGPDTEAPLPGARVVLRDGQFDHFASATTDEEGWFSLPSPVRSDVYLEVRAEGFVPASFDGHAGNGPVIDIPAGVVWGVSDAEWAGWEQQFADCPGAGTGGSVVGEMRGIIAGKVTPVLKVAFARLETLDGDDLGHACYLDDEGTALAPDAQEVGESGRFAFFGLAPGAYVLVQGTRLSDNASLANRHRIWVPDGGVVMEWPALIDLD